MPGRVTRSLYDRVFSKVRITDDCWEWTASKKNKGYGQISMPGRSPAEAHRVVYELLVGPVPKGLELDHLCRNHSCVNPAHLEAVTHQVNMSRMQVRVRTHCPQGHPYSGDNLYVSSKGYKFCRACNNAATRRLKARKREERRAATSET